MIPRTRAFKANPRAFRGDIGDVSMGLRIGVCGSRLRHDFHEAMLVLAKQRVESSQRKTADN